jgi:tetratricopeptide (TPR) repeat protein
VFTIKDKEQILSLFPQYPSNSHLLTKKEYQDYLFSARQTSPQTSKPQPQAPIKVRQESEVKSKEIGSTWLTPTLSSAQTLELRKQVKYCSRYIKANPNDAKGYYNRGLVYGQFGQYLSSLKDLKKAIQLNPKFAYAYNTRSGSYLGLGRFEEAVQDSSRAIQLDPSYARAYNNRASARSGLKDFQGAMDDYNKAIELDPKNAMAYSNRSDVRKDFKDFQGAIEDLTQAIQWGGERLVSTIYYKRGKIYQELNQPQKAIDDFLKAIELGLPLPEMTQEAEEFISSLPKPLIDLSDPSSDDGARLAEGVRLSAEQGFFLRTFRVDPHKTNFSIDHRRFKRLAQDDTLKIFEGERLVFSTSSVKKSLLEWDQAQTAERRESVETLSQERYLKRLFEGVGEIVWIASLVRPQGVVSIPIGEFSRKLKEPEFQKVLGILESWMKARKNSRFVFEDIDDLPGERKEAVNALILKTNQSTRLYPVTTVLPTDIAVVRFGSIQNNHAILPRNFDPENQLVNYAHGFEGDNALNLLLWLMEAGELAGIYGNLSEKVEAVQAIEDSRLLSLIKHSRPFLRTPVSAHLLHEIYTGANTQDSVILELATPSIPWHKIKDLLQALSAMEQVLTFA